MSQLDEPAESTAPSANDEAYADLYDSPEFVALRKAFRRLVFPLTAGFLAWYLLYVLTATYAADFMNNEVVGRVNVGLIFGLLQFASTFGIAYFYSKRAAVEIDPHSAHLLELFKNHGSK